MSAEALKSFDSQESAINSQERQEEAIRQETDRLYSSLDNFNLEQMQTLVDTLSANNPDFQQELTNFQDTNSIRVIEMLKANSESNNNNSNFEYFGIDTQQIGEIKRELDSLDLDLNKILDGYKTYIETNLSGLTKEQTDKVKLSISNRILGLGDEIKDLKYGEDFKNNRWIINEKIADNFSDINNKLLPSLTLLSKINSGESVNLREEGLYDVRDKLEEVKKMLGAEVLSDGDFDKTWKSMELIDANTNNWNILDIRDETNARFLEENGIKSVEDISLLSEKDKQIESTAQYTFYALLAIQIGLEFTPIGWTAGAGIDGADIFSDEDILMKLATSMPWVDSNYKVEKTWIDNALATIGLIPGGTILTKSPKLVNWVFELEPSKFKEFMNILNNSLDEMAKNMGWNNAYVDKIKYTVESLFLGTKQGLPENYINAVEESEFLKDNVVLLEKYKFWESKGIDYNKLITDYVKNNEYGITVEEAHAIYGYTNGIFVDKLNDALRKAETPEELQAIKDKPLVKYLISGLSKMPYANNRQFRGDDFAYENFNVREKKVLNGFTSSANSTEDAFWQYAHLIIDDAKARNISSLAFFVHHADRIGRPLTKQESVIEPGAKIEIKDKELPSNEHPKGFMKTKQIE